jgi:hypothetical protein
MFIHSIKWNKHSSSKAKSSIRARFSHSAPNGARRVFGALNTINITPHPGLQIQDGMSKLEGEAEPYRTGSKAANIRRVQMFMELWGHYNSFRGAKRQFDQLTKTSLSFLNRQLR